MAPIRISLSFSLVDVGRLLQVAGKRQIDHNMRRYNQIRAARVKGSPRLFARVSWGMEARLLAEDTVNVQYPEPGWAAAAHAAASKKAQDIRVLDLREITSFADRFVICHGTNPRQIQAISDAVGENLVNVGERPLSIEGYENAEWILMDYGDFLVHIFSEKAREYYALERLWRHAKDVPVPAPVGQQSTPLS
jgi:ribosome-associated protein